MPAGPRDLATKLDAIRHRYPDRRSLTLPALRFAQEEHGWLPPEALREVVVVRRNSRGDNGAVENFVSAVRCIYRHAVADGFINAAENPATNIDKPRSTRSPRAPATTRSWTR